MSIEDVTPVLEAAGFKPVEAAGPFLMYEREADETRSFAQVILFITPGMGISVFFRVDATGSMGPRLYHFIRSGCLLDLQTVAVMLKDGMPHSLTPPPVIPAHQRWPLRFRINRSYRPSGVLDNQLRFGCYFPSTDLCVNDMGNRGTGRPDRPKVDWIDDDYLNPTDV